MRIDGKVRRRPAGTENPDLPTGAVEIYVSAIEVLGPAGELPLPVFGDQEYPEDTRLKYRFLDLRRERLHNNIIKRGQIIDSIRRRMKEQGFFEFQTPILTASSPEGARDFLVPSRLHPGKFYALPQAPQQFKQLIMIAGFDRYFQIAPCFRDEDARADRSPGEFYQLDVEMSFVTQDDVFDAVEPVLRGVFEEFAGGKPVTPKFPRIPYADALREIRHRQAGPAQPDRDAGCHRDLPRLRLQGVRTHPGDEPEGGGVGDPGADRRQPRVLRPDEFMGAGRGTARPRLHFLCRRERRRHRARARSPTMSDRSAPSRCASNSSLKAGDAVFFVAGEPATFREVRRACAHQDRRRSQPDRRRTVSSSAGSSIFRCSNGTRKTRRSTSRTTRSRCRTWSRTSFSRSIRTTTRRF